jgi:hypothetical protein
MHCLLDKVTARYAVQGLLKLSAMRHNFPEPYQQALLPQVLRPELSWL